MFEPRIVNKLQSIQNIAAMPTVASQVLSAVDNQDFSAAKIAVLLEQDQSLVARLLRVANSPFYGFSRKISTVELAVVVLGTNAIKEILIGLSIKRMFRKVQSLGFNIDAFWTYSLYCASASRVIARKIGYRLAGEAFVAGLMHDIGILIIAQYFGVDYAKIRELMISRNMSLIEAEKYVLKTTHCEIGAWIGKKWNLPDRLLMSILNHHTHFSVFENLDSSSESNKSVDQPLTTVVSVAEWFARKNDYYKWNTENTPSMLYLSEELFDTDQDDDDIYDKESSIALLQNEINDEFLKAGIFAEI